MVNFELNKSFIAKELCIKKTVIGNCCQGKCVLTDQLKKVELDLPFNTADNRQEVKQVQRFSDYTFQIEYLVFQYSLIPISSPNISTYSKSWKSLLPDLDVFHPPQFKA